MLLAMSGHLILLSQPNAHKFLYVADPVSMYDLLPDMDSYVLVEELYQNDTLVSKAVGHTFYNYSNLRYCFYNRETEYGLNGMPLPVEPSLRHMTRMEVVNDSLSLQVKTTFGWDAMTSDTLYVYQANGKVYKVIDLAWRKRRVIHFNYEKDLLVKTVMEDSKFGTSTFKYEYEQGRMVSSDITSPQYGNERSEYDYLDSLIIVTSFNPDDELVGKSVISISEAGDILREESYSRRLGTDTLQLSQRTEYEYIGNNERRVDVKFANGSGTQTIYRWNRDGWLYQTITTGRNQRRVRTYQKM